MNKKIFSGENSANMWNEINNAKTVAQLRRALYGVCCKLQELESKMEEREIKKKRKHLKNR